MEMGETRFYTYSADGQVVGPWAYDQIIRLDQETLVAVAGGNEWWPARRWKPDGTLTVTTHEHARAWLWLIIAAPGAAYVFWPELWRFEALVCWAIVFVIDLLMLACSKREFPRFPGSGLSA